MDWWSLFVVHHPCSIYIKSPKTCLDRSSLKCTRLGLTFSDWEFGSLTSMLQPIDTF